MAASATRRVSVHVRHHQEWLGFIQPTGLVVSAAALEQCGAILNANDVEGQRLLRDCAGGVDSRGYDEAFLPDFRRFAASVLDWSFHPNYYWIRGEGGTAQATVPDGLVHDLPEYGLSLQPDVAVRELQPRDEASPWQLFVQTLPRGTKLDQAVQAGGLEASPHGRLERLLRAKRVPAGLLWNGRTLRLLAAPHGESSGWMDFRVRHMLRKPGRPLCAALRLLLSESRLLKVAPNERLTSLLEESRKYQNTVSERLAEQVLHGLYELLRGFQAAQESSSGALLAHALEQRRDSVYDALLTVLLRLVFLLYAEERGLLAGGDTFAVHYSIGGLHKRLREDAALYPDTMNDRYGAWAQLLALFRMVHYGARSGTLVLPARRGELFTPAKYPFLEGWADSGAPQVTEAIQPPLVPDGTIYRILEKLMVLDGDRISYRALDVEQIGSVYEVLLGFRLELASGRSVAIKAEKKGGAPTTVDLDALVAHGRGDGEKWIKKQTGRKRDLPARVSRALKEADTVEAAHAALGPVIDTAATPDLVPPGAMILQPSDARRKSGTHYTPRQLTGWIVVEALEPILEQAASRPVALPGADDGSAAGATLDNAESGANRGALRKPLEAQVRTPRPEDILGIKVCDPAMGSGAFLVEACRQLAERLLEAWQVHGGRPDIAEDEEEVTVARRLVAQRCLYGVDMNPMAVTLAKMSLWLATFSKGEPLTFLDHAFRCGDSLVGLTRDQIAGFTWEKRALQQLHINERVRKAVVDLRRLRRAVRNSPADTPFVLVEGAWSAARRATDEVRLYGDLAVEISFLEKTKKGRNGLRQQLLRVLEREEQQVEHAERLAERRAGDRPFVPFHWEVEFPEVFEGSNPGFDAVVGNPPFAGKNTLRASQVDRYPEWLRILHEESHGNADLAAHFFRRAFRLLRVGGAFGLVATNTIAQGDTRYTGLRWICTHGGEIYRARRRVKWPGAAAVVVSVVHVLKVARR